MLLNGKCRQMSIFPLVVGKKTPIVPLLFSNFKVSFQALLLSRWKLPVHPRHVVAGPGHGCCKRSAGLAGPQAPHPSSPLTLAW